MRCNICNGQMLSAKDVRLLVCSICGTGRLVQSTISPEYYESADHYSVNEDRLSAIRSNAREVLKVISEYATSGRLLDIGAHTGTFVQEASRLGFDAEGIEPNKNAVIWGNARGINVKHGTLESLDEKTKFDVVTMFHVLEHLPDPSSALKKVTNLLKPSGLVAIEVPNFDSYLAKKDGVGWTFIAQEHLYYFTEKGLRLALMDAGLKVLMLKRRNGELPFFGGRKLLRYFLGKPLTRNRLDETKNPTQQPETTKTDWRKLLLARLIRMLGRADHQLLIVQR